MTLIRPSPTVRRLVEAGDRPRLASLWTAGRYDAFIKEEVSGYGVLWGVPFPASLPVSLALQGRAAGPTVIDPVPDDSASYFRLDRVIAPKGWYASRAERDHSLERSLGLFARGESEWWPPTGWWIEGGLIELYGVWSITCLEAAQARGDTHLRVYHGLCRRPPDPDLRPAPWHPTSTVLPDGTLVPWLAAEGRFAYSPEDPPADNRLFDYREVMPEVFTEKALKGPIPFGIDTRRHAYYELQFWQAARRGEVERVYLSRGRRVGSSFEAPIAVYRFSLVGHPHYMFLQNGSYQLHDASKHPEIERGVLRIGSGIRTNETYLYPSLLTGETSETRHQLLQSYFQLSAYSFSTSTNAFQQAHSRIYSWRSAHITHVYPDAIFELWANRMRRMGIPPWVSRAAKSQMMQRISDLSFSSWDSVYRGKFGPHYVVLETPLSNLRLVSGWTGENEVQLIDPDRVKWIEARGCTVKTFSLTDSVVAHQRIRPRA